MQPTEVKFSIDLLDDIPTAQWASYLCLESKRLIETEVTASESEADMVLDLEVFEVIGNQFQDKAILKAWATFRTYMHIVVCS